MLKQLLIPTIAGYNQQYEPGKKSDTAMSLWDSRELF